MDQLCQTVLATLELENIDSDHLELNQDPEYLEKKRLHEEMHLELQENINTL